MNISKQRLLEEKSQRLEEACDLKGLPTHGRHTYITRAFQDRGVNITSMSVGRWFGATTAPSEENLYILSDILGVRYEWLARGQGRMSDMEAVDDEGEPVKAVVREIPLLDAENLASWLSGSPNIAQRIQAVGAMSHRAFAIRLQDSSLMPELQRNLPVIIDPDTPIHLGSYVLAHLNDYIAFGRYVPRPDSVLIEPVNPAYNPTFVQKQEVVGRIIAIAQTSL